MTAHKGNEKTMSNINLNRWRMNRRQVLKGLGARFALPLLDCMVLPASAASNVPAARPKRSVFLYIPNSINTL